MEEAARNMDAPAVIGKVNAMTTQQQYHLECKKRFGTMLFEIFGNKCLVELCVRFPICSAEQPALILRKFAHHWPAFQKSAEAKKAREISQKKTERAAPRLSKQIYGLKQRQEHGKWIADWVNEKPHRWYQLDRKDKDIWHEYNSGYIARQIVDLQAQQQPRFPGAAEYLANAQF